jgi:hypothetical protein
MNARISNFPRLTDIFRFLAFYAGFIILAFLTAPVVLLIGSAVSSALVARKSVKDSGRLVTAIPALKFAILANGAVWLLLCPLFYYGLSLIIPVEMTEWETMKPFFALLAGGFIALVLVSWVFALLGSWFSPNSTVAELSK